jgi:type IV pilus assembly protein PilM
MPKNQAAWGIEIGAFAIKAIRLERDGDEVTVADFAYIPHAKPLTSPDIDPVEITRLTLQQFVSAKNIEGVKTVVSVPGNVGLARFVPLPPVEAKEIANLVKFEAGQQIPFPIEEVEWDYHRFVSADSPDIEVGIFAIHKDKVRERLSLYAEFGIRPEIVTLGSMAVFNAMTYDLGLGDQHKPAVFLDIGTQSTDVIVAENGRCWIRSFALGGTNFTEALAESFKINYGKADRLKAESASSKYARQMMQAMRPVFGDLVTDVQRSISSYQMSHRDHPIEQAWGVGSTFRIPGLRKFLGQQLNVDVQRVDEFKRIRVEGRDAADFAANSVNMVTAYGLALQGVGLASIAINLSPVSNLREKVWQAKNKWFIAAASVAVAASAALFVRPLMERQFVAGGDAIARAGSVTSAADGLKNKLQAAQGEGGSGSAKANVQMLLDNRSVWPQLVRDAVSATLSTEPAKELATDDPSELVRIPNDQRRLIALQELKGEYAVKPEGGARTIQVEMRIDYVHMDGKPNSFLDGTVGKWLREHADRKEVPYTIDPASIKIAEGKETVIADEAAARTDGSGVPPAAGGGAPPPAPPSAGGSGGSVGGAPGAPPPPSGGGGGGGSGAPGRRRGGGGTVRSGGGMGGMSLGGPAPPSDDKPSVPVDSGGGSGAPAGGSADQAAEVQKSSGDLEQLAPLGSLPVIYGPGAKVFSGTVRFTAVLRGGAARTAEEGAPAS